MFTGHGKMMSPCDRSQVIEEGSVFRNLPGDRESGVHERHAACDHSIAVSFDPVGGVGREPLALDIFLRTIDGQVDRCKP